MPRTADAQGFLAARGGAGLAPLAQAIGAVLREKGRCVAALDGMAAAGKTTAAALLCEAFGGACVHMTISSFRPPCARRSAFHSPAGTCTTSALPKRLHPRCIWDGRCATAYSTARA